MSTYKTISGVNEGVSVERLRFFTHTGYIGCIEDKDLSAPPASPEFGAAYIVASGATGPWEGKEKQLAIWNGIAWQFVEPTNGLSVYVRDEGMFYFFNSTTWQKMSEAFSIVHITPSMSSAEFKSAIEGASNRIVLCTPGTYTLTYDTTGISDYSVITLPQNCIIVAFGAEIKFRYSNTNGNSTQRFVRINQKGCMIMGGTWWIDRTNSAGGSSRRLFYVDNGADPLFYKCRIANSSGAPGVTLDGSGTFGLFIGCLFKPVQSYWIDGQFIYVASGASIDVLGCIFDGNAPDGARGCNMGIEHDSQSRRTIIKNATFRYLLMGIRITHYGWGADQYYVHISDCDFIGMRNTGSGDYSSILFALVNTDRRLFDVTIENCKFEGGNSSSGQIGVITNASYQYGLKNLVIRNCDFVASSAYGTAGYALYFPAYSESPDTYDRKNEIAEISGCNIRGSYYYKPLNIHPDILANIGKFDVRIYS